MECSARYQPATITPRSFSHGCQGMQRVPWIRGAGERHCICDGRRPAQCDQSWQRNRKAGHRMQVQGVVLRSMCNSTYFHPRPKLYRKVMSYLSIFTANLTYFATKKNFVSSAWHIHRIRGPSCGCRQMPQTMAQPTINLHSRVFHDRKHMARWLRNRTRGRCIQTPSVSPKQWR